MLHEFPIRNLNDRATERVWRWLLANAYNCTAMHICTICAKSSTKTRLTVLRSSCATAHQVLLADGIFTRPLTILIRYLHTVIYATAYSCFIYARRDGNDDDARTETETGIVDAIGIVTRDLCDCALCGKVADHFLGQRPICKGDPSK